jgi:uncharacterized protein (TIGR02001 family)
MKKVLIAATVASAFAAPLAAIAADASPHTFTANVGLFSDYRFRGISQTFGQPAIQGGFDYSHASGFYAGVWSSNVYGNGAAAGNPVYVGGSQEVDLYTGYKWSYGDFGLDAGFLQYWYPNAKNLIPTQEKYNNEELYLAGTWKWLVAKYSYGITDFFGYNQNTNNVTGTGFNCGVNPNSPTPATAILTTATQTAGCMAANGGSRGSGYLDLTGTWEVADKLNLIAHFGHQTVKNYGNLSYTDWKLGITKDWAGVTWGAAYIDTNAKKPFYAINEFEGNGTITSKKTGASTLVLSVSKTF